MKEITTDVAIVGSGGAGLRAAIEAHDNGANVLVLSKSMHRKAHTVMAEGGIAAALGNMDKRDNWRVHANDTLKDGIFLGNRTMIETMAKEGPERIMELEHWGCIFDRKKDGKIHQRPFGAHTYDRVCHIGDRTGLEIIQTLADQVRKRKIPYVEEVVVTNLLTSNKRVTGITAVDMKTGEFVIVNCKAVIFCTGGYARIYKNTTNPWECTGDGYAIAYQHGVELIDMEMLQFHPTGMIWPQSARGLLVTESVRGDGGVLLNTNNERFMKKYDPERMELSARDVVARANYTEIKEGRGTERGGVYLDITHKSKDYLNKRLPKMIQQFEDFANVDIRKEKMEVAPTAHYTMGGIKVDPKTMMTTLQGLFAAGETAVSVHGANRLGANSLIDIIVFGRLAGKHAAKFSKKNKLLASNKKQLDAEHKRITTPLKNSKGTKPQKIREAIKDVMERLVNIERSEKDLLKAVKELEKIKKDIPKMAVKGSLHYNHEFTDFLDVFNMIVCAESTTRAALARKESRGAHFRSDYPKTNDTSWLCNLACYKDKTGKMKVRKYKITTKRLW